MLNFKSLQVVQFPLAELFPGYVHCWPLYFIFRMVKDLKSVNFHSPLTKALDSDLGKSRYLK